MRCQKPIQPSCSVPDCQVVVLKLFGPGRPLRRLSVTLHGMWRAVLLVQQSCPARDVCERLPEVFLNTMRPHFLVFFSWELLNLPGSGSACPCCLHAPCCPCRPPSAHKSSSLLMYGFLDVYKCKLWPLAPNPCWAVCWACRSLAQHYNFFAWQRCARPIRHRI